MKTACYIFGEGMLELACASGAPRLGYGADTFNAAVYMARLGLAAQFVTALGDDPFSMRARDEWKRYGLSLDHCLTAPRRVIGLYAVHVDVGGERSFTYWRNQCAARTFFDLDQSGLAEAAMRGASLFYLSTISLSILDERARTRLIDIARAVRANGGHVAFDTNYRSQGWECRTVAREAVEKIMPHVTIALLGLDDSRELFAARTPLSCAEPWLANGAVEIVVKDGENGCHVNCGNGLKHIPAPERISPTDTTGAGDSFNAAYLAARLAGLDVESACARAHLLAGRVIRHHGAIIPDD